ncbi:MAG TPA: hypothetical protein PLE48_00850 [Thiobacillus sp.]|nr:MAG: hypothetical protein B7Y21_05050 [Hydrogenophilales bacterium 16-61-112]HQT30430.1 hypothetical protein [Thiobacillus sp.]HQT68958.1 hypothetical protein [Thiobacillus sp.]
MTPQAFIAKWRANPLTERAGAQAHFEDLCALLEVEPPRVEGEYQYERGLIKKSSASQGWADVWKRGCFACEYKAPDKDLGAALKQLMVYALALDNPPLLVVSDRKRIEIHTHFTGTPSEVHEILLEDIGQPENLQKLRWLFNAPDRYKPRTTTYAVTEEAARKMGKLAERLNAQGNTPLQTAHFLIQCVFCMFAEDAKLLPEKLFERVLDKSNPDGTKAQSRLTALFAAMQKGGDFSLETIPYFNGGLFELIEVPPLTTEDVVHLLDCARMGWGEIEPAILGTLFERGLNPDMRSQLGAHYPDPATILKLIRPVIEAPLLAEWQPVKARIAGLMESYVQGGKGSQTAHRDAQAALAGFIQRLKAYRVLDPACGSGNFLYLALKTLKDLEHRANLEAESLGLHCELVIETSPANVLGIELNPYAAELARVTVWIGEIQWMLAHGYALRRNPILQPLDHIENRDAVLAYRKIDSSSEIYCEPLWPAADAIFGNPPFLGGSMKRGELGDEYFAKSCFETFPFPAGVTAEAIAAAAKQLNTLRETWLNPPEWVDWVRTKEEEQAGFPLRPVAKPSHEAELKKRTLTNLYNARPAWLDHAHRELDAAVAAAYGWTDYTPEMPDEDILKRLLALNLARSSASQVTVGKHARKAMK